jgi:hypothetical protein
MGIARAVSGLYWLLQGNTNPTSAVLSTFGIGNCSWLAASSSSVFAGIQQTEIFLGFLRRAEHLFRLDWVDVRSGTLLSLIAALRSF